MYIRADYNQPDFALDAKFFIKCFWNAKLAAYILEPGDHGLTITLETSFAPEKGLLGGLFKRQRGSSVRAPWRHAGTLKVRTRPTSK